MGRRRVRARKSSEIRPYAKKLIEDCGISSPPVPVDVIAKSIGARLRYAPFDGELAGMLIRNESKGTVVIGVNSLHHLHRQRFTIAHECGHLELHKGKQVHIDHAFRVNSRKILVNPRNDLSSRATDPEEIEANRFAAELLMPFDMVIDDLIAWDLDIEDESELKVLADRYQVSIQALTFRVTNVMEDAL